MKISFVIPCYRSESTLRVVVDEIKKTMLVRAQEHEIILVDDCSPDGTMRTIREIATCDQTVKGIGLAKNFGQHAALMAGFQQAEGDVIVCLDDDGQTPAEEAFSLIDALDDDTDVVYARYESKKHSFFRNMGSGINEIMATWLLGKPRSLYVSSYFAAKRYVIDSVRTYTNSYPYVIGLILQTTAKIKNVLVHHRERQEGKSGYSIRKLLALWMNGFTSFSEKPLRIASYIGCISAVIGFVYGLYIVIRRLMNPSIPMGYSSTMAVLLFMGGLIMLILGILGEYVGRSYISINKSPQYVVREIIAHEETYIAPNNDKMAV